VCVRERKRGRERGGEREREGERGSEREREREGERASERARERGPPQKGPDRERERAIWREREYLVVHTKAIEKDNFLGVCGRCGTCTPDARMACAASLPGISSGRDTICQPMRSE